VSFGSVLLGSVPHNICGVSSVTVNGFEFREHLRTIFEHGKQQYVSGSVQFPLQASTRSGAVDLSGAGVGESLYGELPANARLRA
jgi:hypothetical protein